MLHDHHQWEQRYIATWKAIGAEASLDMLLQEHIQIKYLLVRSLGTTRKVLQPSRTSKTTQSQHSSDWTVPTTMKWYSNSSNLDDHQ